MLAKKLKAKNKQVFFKMKIAIVHDYLKEYGGAERVLEAILEIWTDAEIFTSIYCPEFLGPHKKRLEKWNIHTSFLQKIPLKNKLISAFRIIGPWVFKSFDLSEFDVVIVSQAGTFVSPNLVKTSTKNIKVAYCHTPPRWLYGYSTAGGWERGLKKIIKIILGRIPMSWLKSVDYKAAQLPDFYIANSKEVAGRIKKFYKRDSVVIYPPVEIIKGASLMRSRIGKEAGYFLAGGRLARPKRIDLAIKSANNLKINLKVFGKEFAGYGKELRKMAGSTIEFLGEVSDEERWKLMAKAKAFIFPAEEEDFGITPVEAMGVGTPVIAYRSGGVTESVVEGKTGIFFDEPTAESLSSAIKNFEKIKFKPEDCINQAKKFSKERFKKEMLQFVNQHARTS